MLSLDEAVLQERVPEPTLNRIRRINKGRLCGLFLFVLIDQLAR